MNKTKIDWADSTWNPVTGCLHGCPYCYARTIAERFAGYWNEKMLRHFGGYGGVHDLTKPMYRHTTGKNRSVPVHDVKAAYPFGFDPTFHRYRLDDYIKKSGRKIFVCSMADLFGDWVPDEWIEEVFEACGKAPQHTYIFLTKNPRRYKTLMIHSKNFWFGATATNQRSMEIALDSFMQQRVNTESGVNTFLSIEPLLERIDIKPCDGYFACTDWVIVGAQTGPDAVPPEREWVEHIAERCRASRIPIFMKESLRQLMGADFVQEWPEGMGK